MLCVLKRTENGILKNGVGARSIDILNSGDTLTLNLPSDEGTASAVPADIPLDIIYEDDDILVINKKARYCHARVAQSPLRRAVKCGGISSYERGKGVRIPLCRQT